jgi:hypothetical protein
VRLEIRAIRIAAADVLHVVDVDGLAFSRWQPTDEPVADVRDIDGHVQRYAPLERDVP